MASSTTNATTNMAPMSKDRSTMRPDSRPSPRHSLSRQRLARGDRELSAGAPRFSGASRDSSRMSSLLIRFRSIWIKASDRRQGRTGALSRGRLPSCRCEIEVQDVRVYSRAIRPSDRAELYPEVAERTHVGSQRFEQRSAEVGL